MKLLECYIDNFGKLSKFAYHFKPGMNVFLHENGWGKTTFSAFIRAMLYGLGSGRSSDITQNERPRYAPWQGGKFGGSLTFSDGEGTYRIERTFGARESADTFALYDCHTGLPSTKYGKNLGEDLFGIDSIGYERSTFISERLTAEGASKDYTGIQARLVDMNDLSDYEIAVKHLDKCRQRYQVQSGRGLITEAEKRLSTLRTELAEAEEALKMTNELGRKARELDAKQKELEAELTALRGRLESSSAAMGRRALLAHKDSLIETRDRRREDTAACRAYLSGNIPTTAQVEEQMAVWRTISQRQRPEQVVKTIPAFVAIFMSILGALCVVAGLLTGGVKPIFYILGPVLGAVLLGVGVCLLYLSRRSQETLRAVKAAQTEYDRQAGGLARFLKDFPIVMGDASLKNDGERLWAIRTKLDDLRRATRAEEEAEAALATFRSSNPDLFREYGSFANADDAQAGARMEELLQEIEALRSEKDACAREMGRYGAKAERYTACAQEIANLEAKRAEYIKHLEIIQATQGFLQSARNNLTTKYHGDIQQRFRHYMQLLTQEDRGSLLSDEYAVEAYTVTPDFQVNITKFAQTHPATAMSRGGRDLIALCLRFAICDALFKEENPPLILDDPFINLDDDKIAAAMKLLEKISEERQILYLSCHSSRT